MSRKKPEVGQLLDQMAQGVFAAAREYGWTEEQARKDASPTSSGHPTGSADPTGPGDPTSPGHPTSPVDATSPVDTDGDGTPDYQDTDADGIPDSVEKDRNPDATASPGGTIHPGDTTAAAASPGGSVSGGSVGSGPGSGSGTVGVGGQATGGGTGGAAGGADGLPVAAAIAPVGVLGAAGATAWAVHRRRAQREDATEDEDDYL
jgi:hypothetical protein